MTAMADDVYAMLTWLANCSSFYSVISILTCLVVMVVFILRLKMDQVFWTLPATRSPLACRREMTRLDNPYVLNLNNLDSLELKDDVEMSISCQYPCHVTCLWGADIEDVHSSLQQPCPSLLSELDSGQFLKHPVTLSHRLTISSPSKSHSVQMSCPPLGEGRLGVSPRHSYPLVVLLSLPLGLPDLLVPSSQAVISVYIFHLKDPDCMMKSQLISHFIKLYNGNVLNLQPLFLSAGDHNPSQSRREVNTTYMYRGGEQSQCSDQSRPSDKTEDGMCVETQNLPIQEQSEIPNILSPNDCIDILSVGSDMANRDSDDCVVCQSNSISTVLLPCRHMCVCDGCFCQIDKCPMCRSFIESYFKISENFDSSSLNRWERINEKINSYIGYT